MQVVLKHSVQTHLSSYLLRGDSCLQNQHVVSHEPSHTRPSHPQGVPRVRSQVSAHLR